MTTSGRPRLALLPPLGHDGALYAPLAAALDGHAQVVALDYPGFGARARDAFDYAAPALFERLVDDAHAQLTELGLDGHPYALGGVSLGATLTLALAPRLDPPPAGLLLMASGGRRVARVRRDAVRAAIRERGPAAFARAHLGLDERQLTRSSLRQHIGVEHDAVRAYFTHYFEEVWNAADFDARARAAAAMLDAALDVDLEAELPANDVPAALIWGSADRIFNAKHTQRLRALLGRCELHTLPGVGHYPPLECASRVAEIFLATIDATPALVANS